MDKANMQQQYIKIERKSSGLQNKKIKSENNEGQMKEVTIEASKMLDNC